jgi:phage gp36-like protein
MTAYVTQTDLQYRIGTQAVAALFSDGDGNVDTDSLGAVLQAASDWVDSVLSVEYTGPFPLTQSPLPAMVKEAALLFAIAFSYDRKPEYARQLGDGGRPNYRKIADDLCNEIKKNIKRLVGYTAEPDPANVGGEVLTGTSYADDGVGNGIFKGGWGDF